MPQTQLTRILAIDPSYRGYGFALVEDAQFLVDWGVSQIPRDKHAIALRRLVNMLNRYRPTAIVLEDCSSSQSRRCFRIKSLISAIGVLAKQRQVDVHLCSRLLMRQMWATGNSLTNAEIAVSLARAFPEIAFQVPAPRQCWMKEAYRIPAFVALAFALTLSGRCRTAPISRYIQTSGATIECDTSR